MTGNRIFVWIKDFTKKVLFVLTKRFFLAHNQKLKMSFTKADFAPLDLPNLLINIWLYGDRKNDPIFKNTANGTLSWRPSSGSQSIKILPIKLSDL